MNQRLVADDGRLAAALCLLACVVVAALVCQATSAPWYCWALVWLFATKWWLVLVCGGYA